MKEESNLSLEYQNHPLVLQRALQTHSKVLYPTRQCPYLCIFRELIRGHLRLSIHIRFATKIGMLIILQQRGRLRQICEAHPIANYYDSSSLD